MALAWLLWRAGRKWDKRCRKRESGWQVGRPLAVLAAIAIVAALELAIEAAILLREGPGVVVSIVLTVVRYGLIACLVAEAIAGVGALVVGAFAASAKGLDAALIRLCFRILSIIGVLAVVLHAAGTLGLSVTPIIAGLGVGGLAVALAIRPTLENMIGGFVLFADKPVRVGEFCSFGDKMGTVEEIGLRSTRLRGLDRTVITVPNADFAQMQIVNFTRRDMNLFQCQIGLRYETTPDQLRYVAAKIRKLLIRHDKVSADPARVRFGEFGSSAYVLDVFAFVRAADWNEFMAIKEDLNLRIVEIVRDSGTSFAFPSQTVYLTRDAGVDAARGAATEAEVRHWREEQRLPFPDYDFAERAEMEDTLPFPPEGSPDPTGPPPGPQAKAEPNARRSAAGTCSPAARSRLRRPDRCHRGAGARSRRPGLCDRQPRISREPALAPAFDRPLTILLAGPRGFCAGVERAIDMVKEALRQNGAPVYVRHEIVHNRHVVDELRGAGCRVRRGAGRGARGRAGRVLRPRRAQGGAGRGAAPPAAVRRRDLPAGLQGPSRGRAPPQGGPHRAADRPCRPSRGDRHHGPGGAGLGAAGRERGRRRDASRVPDPARLAYSTQTTLSLADTAAHRRGAAAPFPGDRGAAQRGHLLRHHQPPARRGGDRAARRPVPGGGCAQLVELGAAGRGGARSTAARAPS